MNENPASENQSLTSPAAATQAPSALIASPGNGQLQFLGSHRRNGKVARLPKAARDKVNTMLLDGAT